MFRSLGYTTEVTPASRDGGYDILLRGRDGVMSIVECSFLAKIVLKIAGILFVILAMFQIADLINNKGVKWDAVAVMVGCALVGALCEWLIVRPSMLERRAMEREAIERRQNAEHEKWKRYQDERHDWEWERDRTIWKDGNEE